MTALDVTAAGKAYGPVAALAGAHLSVPEGALVAVLGPSGCGKTTLLRCVAGLERLDAGEIRVAGALVAGPRVHLPAHRRRVALVPQEGALFPHLSVADNVGYGLDRAARRSGRVDEVLALVGLADHHRRMPHQLSGGQQQRVALARALAPRPPLILLDEPFSALDAGLRAELRQDVRAALRADGATAVLVTHDQGEALSLADHVVVMRGGTVVQDGAPADVYAAPADPWVARFVGDAMLLAGTVTGGRARTAAGEAPVVGAGAAGDPGAVTVLVRPEQLRLTPAGDTAPGGITGRVLRHDFHGHDSVTVVGLDDGTRVLSRRLNDGARDEPGTAVTLRIEGPVRAWAADAAR
ncbi:ABC transporter ATP-binding protein [Spirilliplanes yamanashiensis]|uniref:ABC-type quaternary amine transporter n=1 Tax=Spirilliplanes yamanashiensis TaxID=42233 RepID=A0A8J3YBS8_9ACTN|nr:ABC transporter ATP-binding protein [Spirilliplanes yamanashiensis]MDP9818178.1 iron(III) transport system ATP-binding protein [Spirilliplanes yamanashiensis]GIJ04989.1 ABC transporter [Spirilliplanes yamanashiensis]